MFFSFKFFFSKIHTTDEAVRRKYFGELFVFLGFFLDPYLSTVILFIIFFLLHIHEYSVQLKVVICNVPVVNSYI